MSFKLNFVGRFGFHFVIVWFNNTYDGFLGSIVEGDRIWDNIAGFEPEFGDILGGVELIIKGVGIQSTGSQRIMMSAGVGLTIRKVYSDIIGCYRMPDQIWWINIGDKIGVFRFIDCGRNICGDIFRISACRY